MSCVDGGQTFAQNVKLRTTTTTDDLIAHLTESLAIERKRVDLLLGQLTLKSAAIAPSVEIPEPDVPPDAVMAAMKSISPIRDKTFEANWRYWEANKERARLHPEAFAEEILQGASFEVPRT